MTPGPEAPPPASPPGWYQDASDPGLDRYWDGTQWVNDWRPSARTAPQQPPPAQGPDRPAGRSWNFWWYAASIAGIAIGAFGPWVTVLAFSRSGFDGDGQLTLGAAVLALIVLVTVDPFDLKDRVSPAIVAIILGLAVAAVGLLDWQNIDDLAKGSDADSLVTPSAGWGLWLTVFSGSSMFACGIARLGQRTRRTGA